ncbi:MAG: outer membrane beta-barrel protein [Bacteroidota bacterium]
MKFISSFLFKIFIYIILILKTGMLVNAQEINDSVIEILKSKILGKLNHFTFGLYIDAYYNWNLYASQDTSNIVPFSANCPIQDQIRLNVAALEFYYNDEKVRGKLAIQYGDAPNLMAAPNSQWIKTIRQANFGFRIVKNLWIDFGYMFNPIGYESSWAVLNQISFVTIGGYFEPGSVLGAKLSYKFSDKFSGGIMVGNPFSLAYAHNTHMAGLFFLTYRPLKNLSITYNNFFGNQALYGDEIDNDILYNNIIITWSPFKSIDLVGQFDFAGQTNSTMPPDTTKIAGMLSGFLQARFSFAKFFAVAARYEVFNDPHGFLTGININTMRGVRTNGFSFSFEYKPVSFGYIRVAYRYLEGYPGSHIFASNTRDNMKAIIFSTGVRF